jgi:methylmalonyl-CoA mutase
LISCAENYADVYARVRSQVAERALANGAPVLGITGTGGSGKSSLVDELVRRFTTDFPEKKLAVISVDPSKRKTGGALLGDRIRMNAIKHKNVFMRSLATRQSNLALSKHVSEAVQIVQAAGYDLVILETSGIGQSDTEILEHSTVSLYVMTPEYGAPSQLEKINMLDYADLVCVNKFDKAGALDALHDVRKQYKRNHGLWDAKDEDLPVVGTIASQFNDTGVNELFERLMEKLLEKTGVSFKGPIEHHPHLKDTSSQSTIIPPSRVRYLAEIAETLSGYDSWAKSQADLASKLFQLEGVISFLHEGSGTHQSLIQTLQIEKENIKVFYKSRNCLYIDYFYFSFQN